MTQPRLAENVRGKGRHYRHPVTGELVPSITNILDALAKPALPAWAAREVAGAAWDARHSLVSVPDRETAVDMLKGAPYKQRNRKADLGSLVHDVADAFAQDKPLPDFGDDAAPYLDQFVQWVADFDVEFLASEVTVFNVVDGYAGTFDFLARLADGRVVIGDHKTGKGVYPEVALQLAALRWAPEAVVDGQLEQMRTTDGAVVVHLQADGYAMHDVAAGPDAYRTVRALRRVWDWHKGGLADGAVSAPLDAPRREGVA